MNVCICRILPTDMQCTGVRIQLKGIHFLSVQKFQAFQGDNLVDLSSEENNGLQELRENSLISVGEKKRSYCYFPPPPLPLFWDYEGV